MKVQRALNYLIGQEYLFNDWPSLKFEGWGVDYLNVRQRRLGARVAYNWDCETAAPVVTMSGR